jgi:ABC-type amino acid transport substrate-binding protein
MKRLRMIGLALAAAFCVGQADAEELTGTLKKIKETGTIAIGYRDSSIPFSYLLCDRHLHQDRRRREEGAQARQARGRVQSGDVVGPYSIAGERHHRPRMRFDHQ